MVVVVVFIMVLLLAGLWRSELKNVLSNTTKTSSKSKKNKINDNSQEMKQELSNPINPIRDYRVGADNVKGIDEIVVNESIENNKLIGVEVTKEKGNNSELTVSEKKEKMTSELMAKVNELQEEVDELKKDNKEPKREVKSLKKGAQLVEKFKQLERNRENN